MERYVSKGFNQAYLTRQLDLIPISKLGMPITVIGAGAVGSNTVLQLARMGFGNITVIDFDEVSEENMNSQGYFTTHIGRKKVECLQEMVKLAIGFDIKVEDKYYIDDNLTGLVISAVDSMEVRKNIWENCTNAEYIIDPRMAAEFATLAVMKRSSGKDLADYVKTLYTDDEAIHESCTAKATVYCANLLSGLVTKAVKDIATGNPYTRFVHWNIRENALDQYLSE